MKSKKPKNTRTVTISYGNLEDMIESFLRTMKVLTNDEELLDIQWGPADSHLNLCSRNTPMELTITTVKDD